VAEIRLHWGCGDKIAEGWINSDIKSAPGVDISGNILDGLPIASESIDYISTFMNGCVTALMRTSAERQRSASWDRMCERRDAAHRCTKRFSVRRANPDLVV
jgi:hypothetical protein